VLSAKVGVKGKLVEGKQVEKRVVEAAKESWLGARGGHPVGVRVHKVWEWGGREHGVAVEPRRAEGSGEQSGGLKRRMSEDPVRGGSVGALENLESHPVFSAMRLFHISARRCRLHMICCHCCQLNPASVTLRSKEMRLA